MSEKARLKCTVYVGGLDQAVTVQTLAEAFVPFGEVVDITLPKPDVPNSTDLHRGFGYVEFDLPQDAAEAIDNMDGSELYGRTIKVAAAKPQKESNEGLGSKTAIWEQEGYLAKYAVSEEDKMATEEARAASERPHDPMQGLEELDVAGPKPE
ncbi:RNA-binding protein [Aspergillus clavatus NRRL 1]|uniref:Peptidyl prolyl cis-trans isomerase Cyclophilin, putative n=1 Tax=Aspergillus clavatus (strain ATCC 1007 / CBS 513.65 / DSM 816 / NCTC 3887 / NRRL 1 / QM 1276 / 107) TaxID=344612 RepID=A1C6X6_ASPCL|nr:peptidyl prolyl cis-trans isomerase Cyclophilin, putative [Aspergillus clavatus NRRL 1]EAW14147.1 peptidyl prolyl cis-trans isomerase Cyclophilin, putative [Aspergillus clavatus NRRL 1]